MANGRQGATRIRSAWRPGVSKREALERDARRGPAGHGRRVDHQATHCGIGLAGYRKRVGDRQRETQRSQAITDHLQLRSTERGLLAEVQAVDLGEVTLLVAVLVFLNRVGAKGVAASER